MKWLLALTLLVFLSCTRAVPEVDLPKPQREVWVDASALGPGDGTAERPFKTLPATLSSDTHVRLRTGMYAGPFTLPPDVMLSGEGNVVLYAENSPVTVHAVRARLEGLAIQGGTTGLEVTEAVQAERVQFSGQRERAVVARRGASVRFSDASFDGTVAGTDGLVLEPGARASLAKLFFTGAFRRAIDCAEASLTLKEARLLGPKEAVHAVNGSVALEQVTVAGGQGPAIFVAGVTGSMKRIEVQGHEYGLLGRESTLDIDGFLSVRAQTAGMALTQSKLGLQNARFEDSGSYAAVGLLQVEANLRGLDIKRAQAFGVFWRDGKGSLDDAKIYTVTAESAGSGATGGDAVHLRGVDADLRHIDVRDAQGSGLFATMTAKVNVDDLACNRCDYGVVLVERYATVTAKKLKSAYSKVSALSVPDVGFLEVFDIDADSAPGTLLYAECSQGAKVLLHEKGINTTWTESPCVTAVK
ncbi:MAG: hypothetical protein K1X64_07920 [Myxococcaceae bacterium]|nr:hypothetical protein [Myxococcaceae bacterium]